MLEAQHALVLKRIDAWTANTAGDPTAIIDTLFDDFAGWAGEPGWQGSGFTRSVRLPRNWSMLLIEGCHSLILIHGDTNYAKAVAAAAKLLIVHSHSSSRGDII